MTVRIGHEPGTREDSAAPTAEVRLGILGCASITRRKFLPALAHVPALRAVAIASRRLATAREFTARFGGVAVEGYQELLDRDDLDAVYIALPPGLHARWAAQALAAGQHVLCEKPLTTSLAQTAGLVRVAAEGGLTLMENFMFLHHAQHSAVREMIESGVIGEVRAFGSAFAFPPPPLSDIRYRPELGGGALLDAGVYPVRAAQYFLGSGLRAVGSCLHEDPGTGVDVRGSALLSTPEGVTAQLTFGFQHSYRCSYEIWGTAGRIVLDRAFTPPEFGRPVVRIERQDHSEERTLPPDDGFANVAAAFASAVLGGSLAADAGAGLTGEAIVRQATLIDEIRGKATWSRT
jgi:dTDP-3,4-didehydro-2,6-dideoxy-alpha-D-glucose 3-reductase